MAERSGIVLYFDIAEPLKCLSYEDKGKLLDAMLTYGQYGVVPDFTGMLQMAWGFIRPKLDVDAKNYRKKIVMSTYSSYCAKEKRVGRTPMSLEEWLEQEGIDADWNRTVPNGTERFPTTTPTTEPTTAPTTAPTANTESNENTKTDIVTDGGGKGEEEAVTEDFETLRQKRIAQLAALG